MRAFAPYNLPSRKNLLLIAVAILTLNSVADAEYKTVELVLPAQCDRVLPIVTQMFQQRGFTLHRTAQCATCFEGSTAPLYDASGKTVPATTAYKRYVDRKYFPHSNIFRWYTERQFSALTHLVIEPRESGCRVSLGFQFGFYGIEFIAGLPVDGDRISGKSNLRLEKEYLEHLKGLVDPAAALVTSPAK